MTRLDAGKCMYDLRACLLFHRVHQLLWEFVHFKRAIQTFHTSKFQPLLLTTMDMSLL